MNPDRGWRVCYVEVRRKRGAGPQNSSAGGSRAMGPAKRAPGTCPVRAGRRVLLGSQIRVEHFVGAGDQSGDGETVLVEAFAYRLML